MNIQEDPFDGNIYLNLVTRNNNTQESISQKLNQELRADSTYVLSIYLCQSKNLFSIEPLFRRKVLFDEPIVMEIYGSNRSCDKGELLNYTLPVKHSEWREYLFKFTPSQNYQYLMFNVYYEDPDEIYYKNGNISIDMISDIYKINNREITQQE